ncbi:Leucyl aminopeptidase yscIV [Aspergillus nanangensis]|uniref:Peptide hydrolase n=1 Tax=Aspergillus nanangensis TaxID=2582783 RepID=A0AAD4CZI7_ASPNN|nr:Leucyl aminopeptidase yscIV [Aspergillus nanangensis]
MRSLVLASILSLALARGHGHKPVSTDSLPKDIKLNALLKGSQKLEDFAYAYPERNRVFGGEAHQDTVNWLYRELKKTGYYDVSKQSQVHLWSNAEQSLTTADGTEIDVTTMTYSPSLEKTTAEVVAVSNLGCAVSDYPADIEGKIALVQRGDCTFGEKAVYAASAKAIGAIVYNNVAGSLSGTLGAASSELGPYAPIVGIAQTDGQALLDLIKTGPTEVELWIDSQMQNRTTHNVIAKSKGGDHSNEIVIGGHTDSVNQGPGINDDGSGIVSNLVIAKALAKYSIKNAVTFAFWTAEEFGLLGSDYYVQSLSPADLANVRLYLNFDMIASPNYALMIYDGDGSSFNLTGPPGSAEIEHLFEDYYKSRGQGFIPTAFDGRSDYEAFILKGIPAGGVFTGAEQIKTEEQVALFGGEAGIAYDANYHAAGDNMTNLNNEAYLLNAQATAFAIATYANDLSSIPPKNTTASIQKRSAYYSAVRRARSTSSSPHSHSGTGCWHSRVEA